MFKKCCQICKELRETVKIDLPEIENQADAQEADIDLSHPSSDSWARFPRLLLMWRRARQLLQQLLQ